MKVYELSGMECDYDGVRSTLGVFSSLDKAKEYIESNFKYIEVTEDSLISKSLGYVYECYGYGTFNEKEIFDDKDGVYYNYECEDGEIEKFYLTIESLCVKEYEIDSLLATQ